MKNSSAWVTAAVTGLVTGLGGCSTATPRPEVPGAPNEDPAGVPVPRAAQPVTTSDGGKMSCGAMGHDDGGDAPPGGKNMSCGAMKPKAAKPEPPQKMSCAGVNMDSAAGDKKPEAPKTR